MLSRLERQAVALQHRWATPAALRCRALLLLARGEANAALVSAEESAAGFAAAGFPLDRGRALLVAGDAPAGSASAGGQPSGGGGKGGVSRIWGAVPG